MTLQDFTLVDLINNVEIVLYQGDITKIEADAIANAANSSLLGGGGVDGAIHGAAGEELKQECMELSRQGGCPTGEARITTGGKLPAKYVIHTVGPVWHNGKRQESEKLANCYCNSITVAKENSLASLVFPSISTGIFGYPVEKAAKTAKDAVKASLQEAGSLKRLGWCLFDEHTFNIYLKVWER